MISANNYEQISDGRGFETEWYEGEGACPAGVVLGRIKQHMRED